MIVRLALVLAVAGSATAVLAENSKPQPAPVVDTIPKAVDTPYPGTITLAIDATDTQRGIFTVKEVIPVNTAGPTVLLYPEWLPGNHGPRGEIDKLVGLRFTVNGKEIPWTRDPVDVFAFHLDVPAGAKAITVDLKFVGATKSDQGRVVVTPNLLSLQWNSMSLYPAGYFTRDIPVKATVTYPTGWAAASAVPAKANGATYSYDLTNYEVLVDSPVLAGKYYKKWALSPRVNLNVFADNAAELNATPDQIEAHRRLVEQAVKLFGAQHYGTYEFLLSISDELGGIGLEHHQSSENGVKLGYFLDWANMAPTRNLLPHEFTHSWDGKFRRGADLWTPDYRTPMRDSLLWVYEGQTQFWGYVLQARSGLVSKQDTLDAYASIMANYDASRGREWRPLIDTTNDPIISSRRPKAWTSYQRSEDYYNEGLLVWMEVDSMLREQSKGARSLDDFAKAFFGVNDGDWGEVTYTFDDVVDTLNKVQPYDWRGFLTRRLTETGQPAPLGGFTRNGYRLIFTEDQTGYLKQVEKARKQTDLSYSLGLVVARDGEGRKGGDVVSVTWGAPGYTAGLTVGDQILAVDALPYSEDALKAAITRAKDGKPIVLIVKTSGTVRTVPITYRSGLRYPRLEKIGTGETGLDRLLAAR